LAETLGMTVHELEMTMPAAELSQWAVYYAWKNERMEDTQRKAERKAKAASPMDTRGVMARRVKGRS
jgi:hypothetical protein